jgi:hypothetical protein
MNKNPKSQISLVSFVEEKVLHACAKANFWFVDNTKLSISAPAIMAVIRTTQVLGFKYIFDIKI